jgi:hypothetical protein
MGLRLYAMQAKDHRLIDACTDIRMRAERRLGEIMEDTRKAGKLAKCLATLKSGLLATRLLRPSFRVRARLVAAGRGIRGQGRARQEDRSRRD